MHHIPTCPGCYSNPCAYSAMPIAPAFKGNVARILAEFAHQRRLRDPLYAVERTDVAMAA